MRILALVAAYNEERFLRNCLEHLFRQGVEVYLIDNDSTDSTAEIAREYLWRGVVGIERFPREGTYSWRLLLSRKEELAQTLNADWFIHLDPDEVRLPPSSDQTLAQALTKADVAGYNAVNFLEYTFMPTQEAPNHDHPHYLETMRWYYPFAPSFPNRLNAWKRQTARVDLASSGGHRVQFPNLKMYPQSFPMRHYLFLSVAQAVSKYVVRKYDPIEVQAGWHRWRSQMRPELIKLPPASELSTYTTDDALDFSKPRTRHYLSQAMENQTRV